MWTQSEKIKKGCFSEVKVGVKRVRHAKSYQFFLKKLVITLIHNFKLNCLKN